MKLSFAKTVLYEVLQVQIKTVSCKSRMFFVLLWTSLTFCHLVVFKSVYCTDVSVKVLFIYLFIYFILFYFILFFFTLLYWFCHTSTQICHGYTRVPHPEPLSHLPPSLYHPSGSSQRTSPEHPVSCIGPGLAIHFTYDVIHVSMPFSQIISPSPSPRVQKTVLCLKKTLKVWSLCLLLAECSSPSSFAHGVKLFHIYNLIEIHQTTLD